MKLLNQAVMLGLCMIAGSALAYSSGAYVSLGGGINATTMQSSAFSNGSGGTAPPGPGPFVTNNTASNLSSAPTLNFNTSQSSEQSKAVLNLAVGYDWQFSKDYLAVELGYAGRSKTAAVNVNAGNNYTYQSQSHLSNQFSLGVKLGKFLTANDIVYFHPALTYANFNASEQITNSNSPVLMAFPINTVTTVSSINKKLFGGELGLGYTHQFNPHFSTSLEADYIKYQHVSEQNTVTGIASTITTQFKPYSYQISLVAAYHF